MTTNSNKVTVSSNSVGGLFQTPQNARNVNEIKDITLDQIDELLKRAERLNESQKRLSLPQIIERGQRAPRLHVTQKYRMPNKSQMKESINSLSGIDQLGNNSTIQLKKEASRSVLSNNLSYMSTKSPKSPKPHISKISSNSQLSGLKLKSFMNPAGPGDYNVPSCFGQKVFDGSKRNMPNFSIKERTAIPPTSEYASVFQGHHSPGTGIYDIDHDNHRFKKINFSVGRSERFFEQSHIKKIKALPLTYQEQLLTQQNTYKQVSMGYGNKLSDSPSKKALHQNPGPHQYDPHLITSIGYQSPLKRQSIQQHTFGVKYDRYEKICYHGQEQHFYGREGMGPGAYDSNHDTLALSVSKKSMFSGLSTCDRGLLGIKKVDAPGPVSYNSDTIPLKKRQGNAVMSQATREIHFGKYNSIHKALIEKGIV